MGGRSHSLEPRSSQILKGLAQERLRKSAPVGSGDAWGESEASAGGGFAQGGAPKEGGRTRSSPKAEASSDTGKKNCFISFAHDEDGREVNALRAQAKNERTDINFNDYSVKEPFDSAQADYIKRQIRDKLRHCSTTIVYCTDASAKSEWVNWEVEASLKMGKKVICMYQGKRPPKLPPAAEQAEAEGKAHVIPWNVKAINQAMGD